MAVGDPCLDLVDARCLEVGHLAQAFAIIGPTLVNFPLATFLAHAPFDGARGAQLIGGGEVELEDAAVRRWPGQGARLDLGLQRIALENGYVQRGGGELGALVGLDR